MKTRKGKEKNNNMSSKKDMRDGWKEKEKRGRKFDGGRRTKTIGSRKGKK